MRLLQGDETRGVGGLVRMGTVEEAGHAVEALGKPHPGGGAMVVRYADSPEEKLRCALSASMSWRLSCTLSDFSL